MRERTGIISLLVLPIGLSILGARLGVPGFGLASVVASCVLVGLVSLGKISKVWYFWTLFSISLSLLWQTSLLSNYLIGTDIHAEYYYFQLASTYGWDPSIPHGYNSSLATAVLAPFLSKTLHIEGYWVLKVIFPLLFALVPSVLYLAFSRLMGEREAFLAAFFFLAFPMFVLEGTGHAKFMLSGLFFALLILLSVSSSIRGGLRLLLAVISGLLVGASYYSHGYALFAYLVAGGALLVLVRLVPRLRCRSAFTTKGYLLAMVLIIGLTSLYFSQVAEGRTLDTLIYFGQQHLLRWKSVSTQVGVEVEAEERLKSIAENLTPTEISSLVGGNEAKDEAQLEPIASSSPGEGNSTIDTGVCDSLTEVEKRAIKSYLESPAWSQVGLRKLPYLPGNYAPPEQKDNLLRAGLGLDILQVSWEGKVFRILQILTEALVVVGGVYILFRRRSYPDTFVVFVVVSTLLLLAALIKPGFSILFSWPKLYFMTLFFLSPLVIIGGNLLLKEKAPTVLAFGLLIPYFLFTSGFVFEVTGVPNIQTFQVPYSAGLSSHRVDIFGTFTENDKKASDWLQVNSLEGTYIFADLPGMELLYDWGTSADNLINTLPQNWLPQSLDLIPDNSWIFLREWNEKNHKVTYWVNVGLRRSYTYEERGVPSLLGGRSVLYRSGDAVVYGERK